MQIRLYNTLTRSVEAFTPLHDGEVRLYSCGPTVYSFAHIGNMRSFLFADLLQRVLRVVGGYKVRWVMNLTDIDDKIIRDSAIGADTWRAEMGPQSEDVMANLQHFTDFYSTAFIADLERLGFRRHDFFAMPKATECIEDMQELIRLIVRNGFAYRKNGSVYFNVRAWRDADKYGKLLNIDFDQFREGVRIDADEYERDQVSDFVLWKARRAGEPFWDFTIEGEACPGRPGWHIECSAMEKKLLGVPFDIHTGGVDLRFPHHEDEIAQSKAGYGVEPTNFWCHNEFLEVEGGKMSKSLGNFYTLQDLIDKGYDPIDIRYLMLSGQYSSVLNFTFAGLQAASKARARIQEYIYVLHETADSTTTNSPDIQQLRKALFSELANDLNTPKALGMLFSFINDHPAAGLSASARAAVLDVLRNINEIFAAWNIAARPEVEFNIPAEVREWARQRSEARLQKDFALSDILRDRIKDAGFVVKDTKDGYELLPA